MATKTITLGQKIKRYRLVNDIRQEDMADKMGVSRATLINYEKGHTVINVDVLNRLKNNYPDFDAESKENLKPKILVDNSIDFKILAKVLIHKKIYIFLVTILFIVTGVGSSFFLTKYYNAEISLYPAKNDLSQGLGQFQSIAANFGINSADNDQRFNIPEVVKSRLIASKVVNQKGS
jgi:Capsular polysaccharide biosynthesis protein